MSKVKKIIKQDGKEFTLSKPNPLLANQEFMKDEELIFHNFSKNERYVEKAPKKEYKRIEIKESKKEEPKKLVKEEPKEINKEEEEEIIENSIDEYNENSTIYHCLFLEGEEYTRKITFEGIEHKDDNMEYIFESNINIPIKSVIFPSYRKHNRGTVIIRNWWKIDQTRVIDEIHYYRCVLSDINPDFT